MALEDVIIIITIITIVIIIIIITWNLSRSAFSSSSPNRLTRLSRQKLN